MEITWMIVFKIVRFIPMYTCISVRNEIRKLDPCPRFFFWFALYGGTPASKIILKIRIHAHSNELAFKKIFILHRNIFTLANVILYITLLRIPLLFLHSIRLDQEVCGAHE